MVTGLLIAVIYWLFGYWNLGNSRFPGLNFEDDCDWMKTAGRLTLSSLATVVCLGIEALRFRWSLRR